MMRGEMTWYRFLTLFIGIGLWAICFLTFMIRGWSKKRGKDTTE